jgi:site-specific DNA recombinase
MRAHPNLAKAAEGPRLHRREPDPATEDVVRRIFDEFVAGAGIHLIAEGQTQDGIACPSASDCAGHLRTDWPLSTTLDSARPMWTH